MRPLALLVAATLCAPLVTAADQASEPVVPKGQTRTDKAKAGGRIQYWGDRDDQATVLSAGFIGGSGHEWLVDGGFQKDGSLVLVGNVAGGVFDLPVAVAELGPAGSKPAPYQPRQKVDRKSKQPEKDQTGAPIYEPLSWTDPGVTPFVVVLDPGLKKITAAARLTWGSGAVTSAVVAEDGAIYVVGRADAGCERWSSDHQQATSAVPSFKGASCQKTFIAKIAADLKSVAWVRTVDGAARSPVVSLKRDGSIAASLADLRTYDAGGKLLGTVVVEGGLGDRNSVSPVDGEIVYGHEHHWGTGREPWRCPILNIKHPDGSLRYHLMDWGGPYVGLDNNRMVSDTAVRRVGHDSEGNILIQLWSDGGNSVGHKQPTDMWRGAGTRGVGLTTAGANATSFAYLMRLEPENYQITGWTLWATQYGHKANGAGVDAMAEGPDGSFLFAGGTAWGLRQTSNRLVPTEPGGSYVAVLTPDLTGVRYCSSVSGVGMAEIADESKWGVFGGLAKGKGRAVFCAGAGASGDNYGLVHPTPTVDAAQAGHGGGIADGWFVVLDISKPTAPAKVFEAQAGRLTYEREARKVDAKKGKNDIEVADGTVFEFQPDSVKWVTVDAEFRHPDAATWWPNFFYGKPVSGSLTWKGGGATGSVEVACPNLVQPRGDQDRRILGEILQGQDKPELRFTLHSVGPAKKETLERKDNKDRSYQAEVEVADGEATLVVAGRTVKVKPKVVCKTGKVVEKDIPKLTVSAYFTLKGSDLGMKGPAAKEEFDVRISMQGIQQGAATGKKKR